MVKRLFALLSFPLFFLLSACSSISGPLVGELEVRITGLPDGVQANVVAIGPGGESLSFTASGVKLVPVGDWTVEAKAVEAEGKHYIPSVNPAQVKVEYGKRARVEVVYEVDQQTLPGAVYIQVQGLPTGLQGQGKLFGPDGLQVSWTGSGVLSNLPPGSYLMEAYPVDDYEPQVNPASFTLPPGGSQTVQVVYAERKAPKGSLAVQVHGLPGPDLAKIQVVGPNGYTKKLTDSALLEGLEPGTYLVSAYPVNVNGKTYAPTVQGSPAQVEAGGTTTVIITYELELENSQPPEGGG